MEDAVQSGPDGVSIKLHVTTGASKAGFDGYDRWRKCIKVSVRGQPRKGQANAEVVELLSETFDIPKSNVEIVAGAKDRSKTVSLRGLEKKDVLKRLSDVEE